MKTKNIIVKIHSSDDFQYTEDQQEDVLEIKLDHTDVNRMVKENILRDLSHSGLVPNNVIYDLLNFALAIYTIDQVVSRKNNGFQGWSRYFIVNFPVQDFEIWDAVSEEFNKYLSFLSGDKWEFVFRQSEEIRDFVLPENRNPNGITKVSLLSGGLDSFIGAIDLLSNGEIPFFVSHHKTSESKIQDKVLGALKAQFGNTSFKSQKFWVQPNQKNSTAEKENSSRARSFLFITLGVAVANSIDDGIQMVLPENGLISLNIPLTKSRFSSHSTRTTHPFFVDGLNSIFEKLGINNKIENPYRFKTKGEMILQCEDIDFLKEHIAITMSCSHPENGRFLGREPLNCGYCVPCIIRQASEYQTGEIFTSYAIGDVRESVPSQKYKKGSDYHAFKIGLEKLSDINNEHSLALQIIRSGPIPYSTLNELNEYISVYQRGMSEVE